MAHTSSARKRIRQNETRRSRNRTRRASLRTNIKKLRTAIETKDVAQVKELLAPTLSMVDVASSRGAIHANAAARTKSRLASGANAILK